MALSKGREVFDTLHYLIDGTDKSVDIGFLEVK